MMRTRYNKKRNTAFVYEVLIREGTSAILQKDEQRKNAIVKIIKKHFSTRTRYSQKKSKRRMNKLCTKSRQSNRTEKYGEQSIPYPTDGRPLSGPRVDYDSDHSDSDYDYDSGYSSHDYYSYFDYDSDSDFYA